MKTILLNCLLLIGSALSFPIFALTPTPDQIEAIQAMSPAERQRLADQFGVKLQSSTRQSSAPTQDQETVQPRDASRENEEFRNDAVQYDSQRYNSESYGEEEYNANRGNTQRNNQRGQYDDENYDAERYGADAYYNEQVEEDEDPYLFEQDTSDSNSEYDSENYQYERYNSDQYNPSPINPTNPYNAYENREEVGPNSNNLNRTNTQQYGSEPGSSRNSNSTVSPTASPYNRFGTEPSSLNQRQSQDPRNQDPRNQDPRFLPPIQNPNIIQGRDMQIPNQQYPNEFIDPNNPASQKNKNQLNARKKETKEDPNLKYLRQRLKPFGYELFAGSPSTFAPINNVPVPAEYVIGPGDTVVV
ncbi:MAG: hypothetical protein V4629_09630, partial [Pseudomonadota bacterium]